MFEKKDIKLKNIDARNPATTINLSKADINAQDKYFEKLYLDIKKNGIKTPIKLIHMNGKSHYQVFGWPETSSDCGTTWFRNNSSLIRKTSIGT